MSLALLGQFVFCSITIALVLHVSVAWRAYRNTGEITLASVAIAVLTAFAAYATEMEVHGINRNLITTQNQARQDIQVAEQGAAQAQNLADAADLAAQDATVRASRTQSQLIDAMNVIVDQSQELKTLQVDDNSLRQDNVMLRSSIAQASQTLARLRPRTITATAWQNLVSFAQTHPNETIIYRDGPDVEDAAVLVDGICSALTAGGISTKSQLLDTQFKVNPAFEHVLVVGNPATSDAYALATDLLTIDPETRYRLDQNVPIGTVQVYVGIRA